jgi:large subunit ribosomal protein L17
MRHRIKGRKLGRTASHRTATLRALATALIKYKKITTTLAKAKQTRLFVEPLITKAMNDTIHSRRIVAKDIQDKEVLRELFAEVVQKIGDRPGGYTRVVKLGNRVGDAAEMAIIELVDYNDVAAKKSRKPKKKVKETVEEVTATEVEEKIDDVKEEVAELQEEDAADDLTKVEGIGPKISQILIDAGISSFSLLAETEADKVREILAEAGSAYKSHDPETWPKQAKLAAEGKWDELKKWQDELDGGKIKE